MTKFKLVIPNFLGGFAPAWYLNSYASYGNKNMAGDMTNCDLFDPAGITQGPGLTSLTNGTDAGVMSTLLRGILDEAIASNKTYAVGGNMVYQLASASVVNTTAAPESPHGVSGTAVALEDVAYYRNEIFYSYNTTASAQVGRIKTLTAFDDDWGTVSAGATVSAGGPLPLEAGENDMLYLGNMNRVSSWDGSAWINADLDLPKDSEIQDLKWIMNRLFVVANRPDLTGNHKVTGSIYVYDGASDSWEYEIRPGGRVGGLFIDCGILYVFYQDVTLTGGYKLGYISGGNIKEVASFPGSLPQYYQVTKYKNFILWVSGGLLYAFGAIDKSLPSMLFQYADGGYSTVGGLATPFGTPIVASTQSTSFKVAKLANYDKTSSWKSLMFPVGKSVLEKMNVYFDAITTNARADLTITANRGQTSYTAGTNIINTNDNSLRRKQFNLGIPIDNDFRVEINWANGSSANPVRINRIEIFGESAEE